MPKNLVHNTSVRRSPSAPASEKVYCHEPYAQELYDLIIGATPSHHIINKDIGVGERAAIIGYQIDAVTGQITVDLPGHIPVVISGPHEPDFFKYVEIIPTSAGLGHRWRFDGHQRIKDTVEVVITATEPYLMGSLYEAHDSTLRAHLADDFRKGRPNWYRAEIIEMIRGGFIADLGGIRTFLPGSLAAANKILDFASYVGKTVEVMIDNHDPEKESFVVSKKRYIDFIRPSLLLNLEFDRPYVATVTGVGTRIDKVDGRVPYGIFLELEEILTGLLPMSEMSEDTTDVLGEHEIEAGQSLSVWVKEITRDGRIILTQVDPVLRQAELRELKESLEGLVLEGTIRSIKEYGCLIDLGSGLTGLLPKNETRRMRLAPEIKMIVAVQEVNTETGRILLSRASTGKMLRS